MANWIIFLPPILSILLAFILRQVHLALIIGILSGIFIIHGIEWTSISIFFDHYLLQSLTNSDHIYVLLFSLFIGGLVQLISNNGSMIHFVDKISKWAYNKKSTQWVTYCLGLFIFFDDYANTMIVGKTMQPLCDKQGVSREKLAYLVDSTAAPIAGVAFITTWIGAELGYIQDALKILHLDYTAYSVFLHSLHYAYYPIFTLFFIFMLIFLEKDFGPMANTKPILNSSEIDMNDTSHKVPYQYAIISIFLLLGITLFGLWITGKTEADQSLSEIIGNANAYKALLWGSGLACFITILLNLIHKINLHDSIETLLEGFKTMISAISILVLAWMLAHVIKDLKLSENILGLLQNNLSPFYLGGIVFIVAAIMSFATGSSWGTMAILYAICIPLAWNLSTEQALAENVSLDILGHCVAAVLAGAIFGDHCSPISDTTILSSMASNCNHLDHVKTQLPYALTVGIVSLFVSIVIVNFNFHWTINYIIGFILLYLIISFVGEKKR